MVRKKIPVYHLRLIFLRGFLLLLGLGMPLAPLLAQTEVSIDSPTEVEEFSSGATLNLRDLFEQILAFHPVARQARLLNANALQELRMARGGFDPKLTTDFERKEFKESVYFNFWESKFKVPLWVGEVRAGFLQTNGTFLNPENFTSDPAGIASVGFSVPITQGLMIDARRSTLRQAQYFQEIAEAERIKMLNKLLLSAAKDYWEWYFNHQQYLLQDTAYRLAANRFEGVKQRVRLGELAAIDSVEAKINLQTRYIALQEARVAVSNSRIIVSNYLWGERETPLVLREDLSPETFILRRAEVAQSNLNELLIQAEASHPELVKIRNKLRQLEVEERFQRTNLLPAVNLSYDILREVSPTSETAQIDLNRNFKVGFDFSFPIFLRKERAKLQIVRIKQNQQTNELFQARREIANQLRTTYNELSNLGIIIEQQVDMTRNYRLLRNAEIRKFGVGESSLFLIISRETKLIESQVKLESLRTKFEKKRAELYWAAGQLLDRVTQF